MSQQQTTSPFVNIVDLLGKCPAEGALFTTFTLSLAWFEVYLLRQLERNGVRRVAILADPTGIQSSLREGLVSGPGIHYALEPVRQRPGFFHPSSPSCGETVGSSWPSAAAT